MFISPVQSILAGVLKMTMVTRLGLANSQHPDMKGCQWLPSFPLTVSTYISMYSQ